MHIVFFFLFWRIPVVLESRPVISGGEGGGVCAPSTSSPKIRPCNENTLSVCGNIARSSQAGREGGGCAHPLHPPPISAPAMKTLYLYVVISGRGTPLNKLYRYVEPDRILFLSSFDPSLCIKLDNFVLQ